MNRDTLRELSALLAGLVFGAGLVVSGMTRPEKVLGFLDVFGDWDASLMFVMAGAIAVHFVAYRLMRGRSAPLFAPRFLVPTRRDLDAKLLVGAGLFGVGWGLGGYCPGPGIVSLPGGGTSAAVFTIAMLVGMFGAGKLEAALGRAQSQRTTPPAPDKREEFAAGHVPSAKAVPLQEPADRPAELGANGTTSNWRAR